MSFNFVIYICISLLSFCGLLGSVAQVKLILYCPMFHSYLSIKGHFFVISKLNKNTSNLVIQWFRVCAPRPLGETWDATPGSYCQCLLTFEGTENCSFRSCTSSNLSFVSEHPQKPWVFSVVLYVGHLYLRQGMECCLMSLQHGASFPCLHIVCFSSSAGVCPGSLFPSLIKLLILLLTYKRLLKTVFLARCGSKAFNPSTREAHAGESLCVGGQPGLQSEF